MPKYHMLGGLAMLAKVAGWIGIIAAVLMAAVGGIEVGNQNGFGTNGLVGGLLLAVGLIVFAISTLLVLVGEIVQVFIDTESNTNPTVRLLERIAGADNALQRSQLRAPDRIASS